MEYGTIIEHILAAWDNAGVGCSSPVSAIERDPRWADLRCAPKSRMIEGPKADTQSE